MFAGKLARPIIDAPPLVLPVAALAAPTRLEPNPSKTFAVCDGLPKVMELPVTGKLSRRGTRNVESVAFLLGCSATHNVPLPFPLEVNVNAVGSIWANRSVARG